MKMVKIIATQGRPALSKPEYWFVIQRGSAPRHHVKENEDKVFLIPEIIYQENFLGRFQRNSVTICTRENNRIYVGGEVTKYYAEEALMVIHDILSQELRGEIMYHGLPHTKITPEFAADFIRQSVQGDKYEEELIAEIPWEIQKIEALTFAEEGERK